MRLLVVAESLEPRGGWGSYAVGLVRGLIRLGVEARVLVERHEQPTDIAGAEIIPCLTSPLGGLVRPRAMLWNAAQLLHYGRGFDLLHFMVEPYATASLPRGLPPTCITVHGTYAISPFREHLLTRRLYAAALRRAGTVVCVSRFTRDALLGRLPLENLEVIHNGHALVPDERAPIELDDRLDGSPIVLTVGALKARKGYHVSLQAIAQLRNRFPGIRYYLVGDDRDRKYVSDLRRQIDELGLETVATITGMVSDQRLRAYYQQADLFMLTPVNAGRGFEGFGIAYLEANAYGKPVVGSLGCGAEEAIEADVNGLLAPQHDDRAVAAAAVRILGDPELAARLGAGGRAKAEAQTWSAVAKDYLTVYERIVRGR